MADAVSFAAVETEGKIAHAVTMMHAASELAGAAPTLRQKRILTRYVHIHAEPVQSWLRRGLLELRLRPGIGAEQRPRRYPHDPATIPNLPPPQPQPSLQP